MISFGARRSGWALRDETDADRDFARQVYRACRAQEFANSGWPGPALDRFLDSQFALQSSHIETAYPAADRWIVEARGDPIGRLYVDRSGPDWHLIEIGLLPARQNAGVGSAALAWLLGEAKRAGAGSLALYVTNENVRAAALYARNGFVGAFSESATHRRMRRSIS